MEYAGIPTQAWKSWAIRLQDGWICPFPILLERHFLDFEKASSNQTNTEPQWRAYSTVFSSHLKGGDWGSIFKRKMLLNFSHKAPLIEFNFLFDVVVLLSTGYLSTKLNRSALKQTTHYILLDLGLMDNINELVLFFPLKLMRQPCF